MSASLFDFGVYLARNAARLAEQGTGPYFYLPKLESHLEARLWNDVFRFSQERLGIPQGTIKATVLIETILAAFEMEEILYELRDHSAGLNAGRWDYIFSAIKKFRDRDDFVLPDRAQVTMTVPFMRAYTELLVRSCHTRGAHAIGGMAAFIPSRRDAEVNEIALTRVREDKLRESGDGFDGTWVAHPDLVPVAMEVFDAALGEQPNQLERKREDVSTQAADLLNVSATPGEVTEDGVRANVSVGIRYIASWLSGVGAAAIDNLMEDAATAEISRSQIWQWVRHGRVARADVERIVAEVVAELPSERVVEEARALFEQVALADDFVEFLTLPAYERLLSCRANDRAHRRAAAKRTPSGFSRDRNPRQRIPILRERDVGRDEGGRSRARARGGDRLRRDPTRQRAPPGASLRAVPGQPDPGARGLAAPRGARARHLRAEPRRPRADARAGGAPGGIPRARGAREPRDRDRDAEDVGGRPGASSRRPSAASPASRTTSSR